MDRILIISCLSLVCVLVVLLCMPPTLVVHHRVTGSFEQMLPNFSYISNAYGQMTSGRQNESLNIVLSNTSSNINKNTNIHNQTIVSGNVDKSSNPNYSISFITLLSDSLFSVYRMFAALGISF